MNSVSTLPATVNVAPAFVFNSGFFGQSACWQFCDTLESAKRLKSEIGGSGAILSVEHIRAELAEAARYGVALAPHRQSLADAIARQDAGDHIPADEDIAIEEAAASLSVSFAPAAFRVPVVESIALPIQTRRRPRRVVGQECYVPGSPRPGYVVAEIGAGLFWVNTHSAAGIFATMKLRLFDEFEVIERETRYATHTQRTKAIRRRAIERGSDD